MSSSPCSPSAVVRAASGTNRSRLHPRHLKTWEPIGETWRRARVVSTGIIESWGISRTRRRSWRRRWPAGGTEGRR
ncbi:hypothetical protein ACS0PU_009211 [Formica fusca]